MFHEPHREHLPGDTVKQDMWQLLSIHPFDFELCHHLVIINIFNSASDF